MRTETPPQVRLADYCPYPFTIEQVRLTFQLEPSATTVISELTVRRTGEASEPLRLDGERLTLKRIEINGELLGDDDFIVDAEGLTIKSPGNAFKLVIETEISPDANTELSGLYISGNRFCTQCEAEGFRRITYYPDRPDVLAPYFVRVEGDKGRCPYLLSNGNPAATGDLPNGRHFAEWDDPHPKPSYLFALVGGDFDVLEDSHTTSPSQRAVRLAIYVEKGDAERAAYAMRSLKRSMEWDEDVFGREYDLDIFQIVAVRDFNFGAMENKGLNIFNSAYVLADGKTATDSDFEAIESIVAHEYFHNWTGNRITCRDWFQLCLKEGLTVYRDQEFTKAMRSPAVARIKEVIRLRTRQFPEDSGPLAHPVRPDGYARIDNLYTATVYEKGAELIRMLRLFVGEEAFFAGINRYFDHNDGKAATIEDFIESFQASTDRDLDAFAKWYAQAGTPTVRASGAYDAAARTYRLSLAQSTAPTPGQPVKQAMRIPMRVSLFDANGVKMETGLAGETAAEHVVVLDADAVDFTFTNVGSTPRPSLNRGFSAPIRLLDDLSESDRAALAGFDDDPFAQWEALQTIARALILETVKAGASAPEPARLEAYLAALNHSATRAVEADPAFAALLLYIPVVGELIHDIPDADPSAIHTVRAAIRRAVGERLEKVLLAKVADTLPTTFDPSADAAGRRSLRSAALSLLSTLGSRHEGKIVAAFASATTMTESLAALTALSGIESDAFDKALADFEAKWSSAPLVMDKWFGVQAMAIRDDIRERLVRLMARPDYDLKNPNRVRALAGAFASSNPVAFHAADGWGYRFVTDLILKVDPLNPALSARLATAFESWRSFDAPRREQARTELDRLAAAGLSKNALDIIGRALADPA